MKKTILCLICLLTLLCVPGCQDKKSYVNHPQEWTGIYQHPNQEGTTVYLLSYNVKNKPPTLIMRTFDEKGEEQKSSVRTLCVVKNYNNGVIMAPTDVFDTKDYDEERDAIVFYVEDESTAKIVSLDEKFVLPMKRKGS